MKKLFIIGMMLMTTQAALAGNRDSRDSRQDERTCMDSLDSEREEIADLKRENSKLRREILDLKRAPRNEIGTIGHSQYLIGSTCGKIADYAFVTAGSTVEILGPQVDFGSYGTDAVRVRVISNTVNDSISAEVGCEGFALNTYIIR